MRETTPPLSQYVFMAWCLVKHRDNFTFLPLLSYYAFILCSISCEKHVQIKKKLFFYR